MYLNYFVVVDSVVINKESLLDEIPRNVSMKTKIFTLSSYVAINRSQKSIQPTSMYIDTCNNFFETL